MQEKRTFRWKLITVIHKQNIQKYIDVLIDDAAVSMMLVDTVRTYTMCIIDIIA